MAQDCPEIMAQERLAISTLTSLVAITVIIIAAIGYIVIAPSLNAGGIGNSKIETTSSLVGQNQTLVGTCAVTTYLLPDTEVIYATNVTTVSSGTTTYYLSTYSTATATNEAIGSTAYTTTTSANRATSYVITTTSVDSNAIPSSRWSVTVCTFTPQG